jgi:tetratricopeptide (TPR) repeat protein
MNEPTSEPSLSAPSSDPPPSLPDTLEELLALGHQRLDEQQFAEAQQAFAKALTLSPSNVQVRHNLGYALERQGATEEAIAAYEAVVQGATPLAQSAVNVGVLRATVGQESAAQEAFDQALRLHPACLTAYINLGVLHARAGRLAEARQCYEKALEIDPFGQSARLRVANLLVREGRVEEALEAYERLAEEGWNSAEVQYRRGVALSRQGDEDGAIQAYQQLALVYAGRQRYDEAAVLLQRAAELAPNDVQVHYNLGNMQARQAIEAGELMNYGYADAALHAYRRAIELDPQCLKAYYNLACVAEKMSPQEGITAWEQYIAASSAVPAEQEWMVKARGYLRSLKAP